MSARAAQGSVQALLPGDLHHEHECGLLNGQPLSCPGRAVSVGKHDGAHRRSRQLRYRDQPVVLSDRFRVLPCSLRRARTMLASVLAMRIGVPWAGPCDQIAERILDASGMICQLAERCGRSPPSPSPREVTCLSRSRISRVRCSARLLARSRAACACSRACRSALPSARPVSWPSTCQPDLVGLRWLILSADH